MNFATAGNDSLAGTAGDDLIDGGLGGDTVSGAEGNDTLFGGLGDDVLIGGAGDDVLDSGAGRNLLFGDAGNDTLQGGDADSIVIMAGGAGDDLFLVRSLQTLILPPQDEGDRTEIQVDFYKVPGWLKNVSWAPGVQKLPYWIDALLADTATVPRMLMQDNVIKVAFPQSMPSHYSAQDRVGFTPFTAQQIEYTRKALAYISSVIDVRFEETSDAEAPLTIVLANNDQELSGGYAGQLNPEAPSKLMIANSEWVHHPQFDDGAYFQSILMHELGHVLGLKHPFSHADSVGNVGDGPFLPEAEDNNGYTIMSYDSTYELQQPTFRGFDIAALQYLWGVSPTVFNGDSTYLLLTSQFNLVTDAGGSDTLDASRFGLDMVLDLRPGYWGHIGPKAELFSAPGQVTIGFGTVLENLLGGSGHDRLTGNAVGNRIEGGQGDDMLSGLGGNDTLDGGAGRDFASFSGKRADYTVSVKDGKTLVSDRSGAEGVDVLSGIERLRFSDLDVALDVDGKSASIFRLYQAAFNRAPDLPGLGFWLRQVDQGAALEKIAFGFTQSDEFTGLYGKGTDDANFVASLYRNALHREHEKAGFDFWINLLQNGGYTRERVLLAFAESAENQARVAEVIANGFDYQPFLA